MSRWKGTFDFPAEVDVVLMKHTGVYDISWDGKAAAPTHSRLQLPEAFRVSKGSPSSGVNHPGLWIVLLPQYPRQFLEGKTLLFGWVKDEKYILSPYKILLVFQNLKLIKPIY